MVCPILETDRLILRVPELSDLDALAAFMADPVTMEFLGGAKSRPEAWRTLAVLSGSWALQGFGMFSVIEKISGRWIGRVGPWQPEGWPGPEIAWGIARDAWGRGYAAEAATRSMIWARDVFRWDRVIHTIDPLNLRSIALAERVGSKRIGDALLPPPGNQPVDIYGQTLR